MKKCMVLSSFLLVLSVCYLAGCGGGGGAPANGGDGGISYTYTVKLIKTDGTEVDPTARPIPLGTKVKITFDPAVEEADRDSIQTAIKLLDPDSAEVAGSFSWNDTFTELTFTPTRRLAYQSVYTLSVTAITSNTSASYKDIAAGSVPFTTMTKGDVNGDGYADLIMGAYAAGASSEGEVYLSLGSASGISNCDLSSACIPDATITGDAIAGNLGQSVSMAGDVNGDGYEDIIIGGSGVNLGEGEAYVFYGGSSSLSGSLTPSNADATITAEASTDSLGYSVASAGDVNGDGFDDIIVGAPEAGPGNEGQAYVFHGSSSGIGSCDLSDTCTAQATITGASLGDSLGYSVSPAGDVNGDGYDDILIGAFSADGGGTDRGEAYVYHGGSGLTGDLATTNANATIEGSSDSAELGWSVYTAGDVNGDGYDDVLLGEPHYDTSKGRAYLLTGSSSGVSNCDIAANPSCPAVTLTTTSNEALGYSIATAGDVNGDGYDDVLVGTTINRAYVFHGMATLTSTVTTADADTVLDGRADFGREVGGARDYNGDGYSDFAVGAAEAYSIKGEVDVFNGKSGGVDDCDLTAGCNADAEIIGKTDGDQLSRVR